MKPTAAVSTEASGRCAIAAPAGCDTGPATQRHYDYHHGILARDTLTPGHLCHAPPPPIDNSVGCARARSWLRLLTTGAAGLCQLPNESRTLCPHDVVHRELPLLRR